MIKNNNVVSTFGNINSRVNDITEFDNFAQFVNAGILPDGGFNSPLYVMWELTNVCPNKCLYCYNGSHKIKSTELSTREKFNIADQLLDAKIFQICLTGGEPKACKDLLDLIRYFSTNGVRVSTILSGALLNKRDIIKISEYINMVQISLDGSTEEIHDFVRNRKGSFNEAIKAIKTFISLGVDVKASFAMTKFNIDDFENTYELCKSLGVTSLRTQRLAVSGRAKDNKNSIYASEQQIAKLEKFVTEKSKERTQKILIEYRNPYGHVEFGIKNGYAIMVRITPQGLVGFTPYIDAFFGDLKKEKFSDIWNKMKMGWHNPKMLEYAKEMIAYKNGTLYNPTDKTFMIGED